MTGARNTYDLAKTGRLPDHHLRDRHRRETRGRSSNSLGHNCMHLASVTFGVVDNRGLQSVFLFIECVVVSAVDRS